MTSPAPDDRQPTPEELRIRDGRHRFARSPATAANDARAADLRAQGWTYQQIADEIGYKGKTSAIAAVRRAIRDACAGPAQALIDLEVSRLEAITDEVLDILQRDHVVVSHGKIVRGDDGRPLLDDSIKLQAIDRYLRARESFRKLLGLDKPTKVDATVHQVDQADIELAELIREEDAKNAVNEERIKGSGD
jgi:hypothetical protein